MIKRGVLCAATVLLLPAAVFGQAHVYYSVCPAGTGDLKDSGDEISITSGVLTVETGDWSSKNIGRGVCIEYASTKCYISAVNSVSSYDVITATGGTPSNQTTTSVTSLHHEYASCSAWEAGFTDANHINDTSLVSANVVAHAVCYGATADTTSCLISGTTTGANNYIKFSVPRGLSYNESLSNNRHQGVWSTSYFRHVMSSSFCFRWYDPDIRWEGLQLNTGDNTAGVIQGGTNADAIEVSHCIIQGNSEASQHALQIMYMANGSTYKLWNTLIYDQTGTGSVGLHIEDAQVDAYIHNNTIVDCAIGIAFVDGTEYMRNNIVDCTDCFSGSFTLANNKMNLATDDAGDTNAYGTSPAGKGNASLTYVAAGSDNFHLDTGSTDGIDCGYNLYSDGDCPVVDDVDGHARPTSGNTFEVGFDEHVGAPPTGQPYILRIPRRFPMPFGRRQYR